MNNEGSGQGKLAGSVSYTGKTELVLLLLLLHVLFVLNPVGFCLEDTQKYQSPLTELEEGYHRRLIKNPAHGRH